MDVDLESTCCVSVCPNPTVSLPQPHTSLTLVYNKLLGTQVVPLPLALTIPTHLIITTGCYMTVVCFNTLCAQRYSLPCRQPWLKNCKQWFGSGDGRQGELWMVALQGLVVWRDKVMCLQCNELVLSLLLAARVLLVSNRVFP